MTVAGAPPAVLASLILPHPLLCHSSLGLLFHQLSFLSFLLLLSLLFLQYLALSNTNQVICHSFPHSPLVPQFFPLLYPWYLFLYTISKYLVLFPTLFLRYVVMTVLFSCVWLMPGSLTSPSSSQRANCSPVIPLVITVVICFLLMINLYDKDYGDFFGLQMPGSSSSSSSLWYHFHHR